MKVIKRSQVAVVAISLMLVCAGYLNYKYGPDEKNLGANIFVSEKDLFLYNNDIQKINSELDEKQKNANNEPIYEEKTQENNDKKLTFVDTLNDLRIERDKTESEFIDNYRKIIDNQNTNNEQKKIAQESIDKILNSKKTINVIETILKMKGIDDIVVIPTNASVNVIVLADEKLEPIQVGQIQTVVQKELNVDAGKITITQK